MLDRVEVSEFLDMHEIIGLHFLMLVIMEGKVWADVILIILLCVDWTSTEDHRVHYH